MDDAHASFWGASMASETPRWMKLEWDRRLLSVYMDGFPRSTTSTLKGQRRRRCGGILSDLVSCHRLQGSTQTKSRSRHNSLSISGARTEFYIVTCIYTCLYTSTGEGTQPFYRKARDTKALLEINERLRDIVQRFGKVLKKHRNARRSKKS